MCRIGMSTNALQCLRKMHRLKSSFFSSRASHTEIDRALPQINVLWFCNILCLFVLLRSFKLNTVTNSYTAEESNSRVWPYGFCANFQYFHYGNSSKWWIILAVPWDWLYRDFTVLKVLQNIVACHKDYMNGRTVPRVNSVIDQLYWIEHYI